jgi:hypothetical protein
VTVLGFSIAIHPPERYRTLAPGRAR